MNVSFRYEATRALPGLLNALYTSFTLHTSMDVASCFDVSIAYFLVDTVRMCRNVYHSYDVATAAFMIHHCIAIYALTCDLDASHAYMFYILELSNIPLNLTHISIKTFGKRSSVTFTCTCAEFLIYGFLRCVYCAYLFLTKSSTVLECILFLVLYAMGVVWTVRIFRHIPRTYPAPARISVT
jgi:hypothetical protein